MANGRARRAKTASTPGITPPQPPPPPPAPPPVTVTKKAMVADLLIKTVIPVVVALIGAGTFRSCAHVGKWYELALDPAWTNTNGSPPFAVLKDSNGIVHFRGSASHKGSDINTDRLLQLREEFRPAIGAAGAIVGSAPGLPSCAVAVDANGMVTFSACGATVYMDGFSYPAKDSPIGF
jgi:hypothetical protein